MLKNYFKIAIAVLRRRKFFTFISLFGISFTLTILMVASAFLDKAISADYPDMKRDRSLYLTAVELRNTKLGWFNRSPLSLYYINTYLSTLKKPEKIAFSSSSSAANTYVNNKKIVVDYKYTNAAFWQVMEFDFLEGKPYNQKQIDQAQHVAVISEGLKKKYFGDVPSVIGKYIEADNTRYQVIGVVKDVSKTLWNVYGNMYLPYTTSKFSDKNTDLMGSYTAVLVAKSTGEIPAMVAEYNQMLKKVPFDKKQFDQLDIRPDTYLASLTRGILGDDKSTGITKFFQVLGLVTFIFLLLPTINLVNINITRIMERSSEIGVRKAFGASSRTLVFQFVIENMILTCIGGLIGLVLSVLAIYFINSADLIGNLNLTMNLKVLFYSFIACLFFGLLSGVYPAWQMSRLNVVTALKAQ
jgi:putative ABC transport system permease protein